MDKEFPIKIRVVNLHKSFGGNRVLRGCDLEVRQGESMVVIGGSGSGKTVLIKCIIGLIRPDEGEIYVDGLEITQLKEREMNEVRKKFGMLFQGGALFDSLRVWENVGFGLVQHTQLSEEEIRKIATEKLRLVGLKDIEDRMPAELSGGMRKRVSLARAIAMEPEILLYDEPTTGIDPIMADAINDLIIQMREKLNVTSIAITHDMKSAYKIADRIAMLYQGKIIEVGTPHEIKGSPNPIVQQFVQGKSEGPIQIL
ncbi:MAG: ABC transporter ATP-binding protein [Syntrophaceae bacterium]|nr:ABC transporter ATP-binding protein [Syntrophaceae bacterium]